jgi:hypothetical protein
MIVGISDLDHHHHTKHLDEMASHLSGHLYYNIKPTSGLTFTSSYPTISPAKAPNAWTSGLSDNAAGAIMTTIQSWTQRWKTRDGWNPTAK